MSIAKWLFRTPFGSPDSFTTIPGTLIHGGVWGLISATAVLAPLLLFAANH